MIQRLSRTTLMVDDQNTAKDFYVDKPDFRRPMRADSLPTGVMPTADCRKTYEELKRKASSSKASPKIGSTASKHSSATPSATGSV